VFKGRSKHRNPRRADILAEISRLNMAGAFSRTVAYRKAMV
jgi:hypothetical protein